MVAIGPASVPWLQRALADEKLVSRRADILHEIQANISKLGEPPQSFIEALVGCVVDQITIPACDARNREVQSAAVTVLGRMVVDP